MQAVILAAGQGTRLAPFTDRSPKCMVEVQGIPLLQYQIEALDAAGVLKTVIVVGHRASQVRKYFGTRFGRVAISYVENRLFDRTNNLYSLWLALQEITGDILLLEGDLLFEPELLTELLETRYENVAVVDRFQPFMNGTVIAVRGDTAEAMVLKKDQGEGFPYGAVVKTVNIYKFQHETTRTLMRFLERYVAQGLTDDYYEIVISRAIEQGSMRLDVLRTEDRAWTEIDTPQDLADAERMRCWPAGAIGTRMAQSAGVESREAHRG